MIIPIMIGLTIVMVLSWFLIPNKLLKITLGTLSTLLLLASALALSAHLNSHWGMKEVTDTKTSNSIYTAAQVDSPVSILVTQEVGTDSDNYVLVYRDKKTDEKPEAHFAPDKKNIIDSVKKTATYKVANVTEPTIVTTKKTWTWENDTFKKLFEVDDETDNELISEETLVTVPQKNWLAMTADQSKKLAEKQKSADPKAAQAQQEQMKLVISQKVKEFMMKNPKATQDQIKEFTEDQTREMTMNAIKKMIE